MNFLAHIYLSGDNDLIKIGNFMADGIKGDDYKNYSTDLRKGILLHRAIDSYTDSHPIFRKSKHRLHEHYGHYSGVIMDIFYDHFLAKNWSLYSDIPLSQYVFNFYKLLENNFDILTLRIQKMFPSMVKENWLVSYADIYGLNKILYQMDYRTQFQSKMQYATNELREYYEDFESEFFIFFEDIQKMVSQKIDNN
ncbi:ACP phosphodiesterase [Flavobacterium sp. 9AF]|uniref:acyl carrier protein phosphodiesterase n=1 Tax=Flavobacterium sp. 9AF TaxID=2653142 RepID=UPI0012F28D35|nr:acyl carrier protein phosphodiesterase [Flavobacterium sp. 9AF]VXB65497.1 ACP phosphodiesterase [Flavobacterium sp. 9AF]